MLVASSVGWRVRVCWLSAAFAAIAGSLVLASSLSGQEEDGVLTIAIFAALPWSLLLMALDVVAGFGTWAALIVSLGICLNAAVVWTLVVLWRGWHSSGSPSRRDDA